jgi:hypothetical protein
VKPSSVEIRAYQVGFGDCFLVSFLYPGSARRHVLIDFGTMELPPRGSKTVPRSEHMERVATDIAAVCGGQLTAVVATHRHADHISGFATDGAGGGSGRIIADCKPKVVLQPWTEDPQAARDAKKATVDSRRSRKSFVSGLNAMHRVAEALYAIGASPPRNLSRAVARQLAFLGMDNIANVSAVKNLIAMGERPGATAVFAHHGSNAGLARLLPGVRVRVLGPPDLTQTEKIRTMRASDPQEFWQLMAGKKTLRELGVAARPARGGGKIPAEARWFQKRLAGMAGEQLLEIVRTLDDETNNTSLILLFEVGGKKLLFPGDAQLENWSWALADAPDAADTRKRLADVDVYKVGHHGSRNATPKEMLWEGFRKRGGDSGKRMHSLLSTLPGKHGSPAKKTEVPRKTLRNALQHETHLLDTDDLSMAAGAPLCHLLTIPV